MIHTVYRYLLLPYLVLAGVCSSNAFSSTSEDKLLVAYVYNLVKFIDWPSDYIAANQPVNICFYGKTGHLSDEANALTTKKIKQHPIKIFHLDRGEKIQHCHVLHISDSEELYFRPLLAEIKNKPILTMSRSSKFIGAGGMIGFVYSKDKLRFDINKKAVNDASMTVSSQVLRLAREVTTE